MKTKTFLLSIALVFSVLTTKAQDEKGYEIGVSAKYWLGGEMYFNGTVDKEPGFFLNAYADYNIVPKFAVGAYTNFGPGMKIEGSDRSATMAEFGMQMKIRIFAGNIKICPALQIGYRSISVEDYAILKADAMALNLNVDFVIPTKSKIALVPSFGFLAQPVGGNDYGDVTFTPIIFVGFGVSI